MKSKHWKQMTAVAFTLAALVPGCGKTTPSAPGDTPPAVNPTIRVNVLVIGGLAYPAEQFHVAPPDRCDAAHWHANRAVFSIGTPTGVLEGVLCHDNFQFPQRSDPDPGGCGFGRTSEVVAMNAIVSSACWTNWVLTR